MWLVVWVLRVGDVWEREVLRHLFFCSDKVEVEVLELSEILQSRA